MNWKEILYLAKIGKEINEPKDFIKSIYFLNIEDKTNYSESQLEEKIIEKLEYSYVKSHMIWGSNYDAMLRWALEGADATKVTTTGNAAHNLSAVYETGKETILNKVDRINNIYDLEGNGVEWTAEAVGTYSRIYRGGGYIVNHLPSIRYSYSPSDTGAGFCSRSLLYIK